MSTANEIVKKFIYSLDHTTLTGEAALNEAINFCTYGQYTTMQSLINEIVSVVKK